MTSFSDTRATCLSMHQSIGSEARARNWVVLTGPTGSLLPVQLPQMDAAQALNKGSKAAVEASQSTSRPTGERGRRLRSSCAARSSSATLEVMDLGIAKKKESCEEMRKALRILSLSVHLFHWTEPRVATYRIGERRRRRHAAFTGCVRRALRRQRQRVGGRRSGGRVCEAVREQQHSPGPRQVDEEEA